MNKDSLLTEITLQQLRTFLAVAENRGIRKAADALYLDPSTVHTHLHNLEASLGLKLVVFDGRKFGLTEGGEILYESTRGMVDMLWGAVEQLNSITAGLKGHLRVMTTIPLATYVLIPTAVEVFKTRFPQIEIELMIGPLLKDFERLSRGECDLAISADPPPDRGALPFVCKEYFIDRLVGVKLRGSKPHPKTLIYLGKDTGTHGIAGKSGLNFETGMRYTDYEQAKRLGMETGGLVLMSEFAILSELRAGIFEMYENFSPTYKRTFHFVFKKDPPLSLIGQRFIELCLQNLPYELALNTVDVSDSLVGAELG